MKSCENWSCWKECIELGLKIVFVGVFTWGVCSAVCCMSSCNSSSSCGAKSTACCKTVSTDAAKCAPDCQKPCCK